MAADPVNTMFYAQSVNQRLIVVTSESAIWEFDGQVWQDITGAAVADGTSERWTGGWLSGGLTLANRLVTRTYRPGIDVSSQAMVYDGETGQTWEDRQRSALVFRPFREYMLAANVREGSSEFPSFIQWCDPVLPGQIPTDWMTRDTNRAGDVDLPDTPGEIVDMIPLRDYLMIYKTDSVYTCQWIGGNDVFAFRRLTKAKGIFARNTVAEYLSRHWAQGSEDIFLLDGNSITSLLWGKLKRSWLNDRDPDRAQNNWTVHDPINEEMLFGYVSVNAPAEYKFPDKILACSLKNNAWHFREYGVEIPFCLMALSVENQQSADLLLYGIDRTNSRLLDLESAPDRLGAPVPAYFLRTGLFSDPGHDFVQVDRAKLQITGNQATLKLGDQIAIDAGVTWRGDFTVNPVSDYKTDARANGNLIAYRVDIDTLNDWQVSNLILLVQKSGGRG